VKNQNAQNGSGESKPANGQGAEHGVLESTAQAIGSTLGNLAVKTGIAKAPQGKPHDSSTSEASNGNVVSMAGHKPGGKNARRSKKKK
jgi:hypothetical protein